MSAIQHPVPIEAYYRKSVALKLQPSVLSVPCCCRDLTLTNINQRELNNNLAFIKLIQIIQLINLTKQIIKFNNAVV